MGIQTSIIEIAMSYEVTEKQLCDEIIFWRKYIAKQYIQKDEVAKKRATHALNFAIQKLNTYRIKQNQYL